MNLSLMSIRPENGPLKGYYTVFFKNSYGLLAVTCDNTKAHTAYAHIRKYIETKNYKKITTITRDMDKITFAKMLAIKNNKEITSLTILDGEDWAASEVAEIHTIPFTI